MNSTTLLAERARPMLSCNPTRLARRRCSTSTLPASNTSSAAAVRCVFQRFRTKSLARRPSPATRLALHELGQHAARHRGVHEHLALDRIAGARIADEANALFAQLSDRLLEIVDLHRDEMHAFAEIGEAFRDRALVAEVRDQFDLGVR